MPVDDEDMKRIAELEVRRYFDHYLQNILPDQQKAGRAHTHTMIERHDADVEAHDGVARKVNRMVWIGLGAGAVMGVGGFAGAKALLAIL